MDSFEPNTSDLYLRLFHVFSGSARATQGEGERVADVMHVIRFFNRPDPLKAIENETV